MEIAIVGLGSWGLCILERLLDRARAAPVPLAIHVIQPGAPGPGVHSPDEPEYLLMNTVCGQVSLFAAGEFSPGLSERSGITLYEWAVKNGYRIVGGECRRTASEGRALTPHDFLPRCVLGEYLAWAYRVLTAELPPGATLTHHDSEAVDVQRAGPRERVELANGASVTVDHVFLATGHTPNREPLHPFVRPYPTASLGAAVPAGASVAIAGMGLVAVDVLAALTFGRGGRFETGPSEGSKRYIPSGREPRIFLYSRNGLPFCCRPAVGLDTTGSFRPEIFTEDELARRRHARARATGSPQLDLRQDVLPLVWAEMTLVYYGRSALLADGDAAAERVSQRLLDAWRAGALREAVAELATAYGTFDAEAWFFRPDVSRAADRETYQAGVRAMIERDTRESALGEARSPLKAVFELFRVLRDTIRSAVDFGGLTPDSAHEFWDRIAPLINRVMVGPPLRRGQELLGLIDAGVVQIPFGGSPTVTLDPQAKCWEIASTRLGAPTRERVDHVIAGYLEQPSVDRSASPVLSRLHTGGRIRVFQGGFGIDVSRGHHPVDARGEEAQRLWVLGPLTDGTKYFNHYIPSPKSRFRAFRDADASVRAILGEATASDEEAP
jgi:uncharacterized NAD(P)/FAD-binding protein YdhS